MTAPFNERLSRLLNALETLVDVGGDNERTSIVPNVLVVDSAPADLPAGYIIVANELGYYVPAVKVAGLTVINGDFVNLLYIKGTEPIAFQQGSGSSGSSVTPHNLLSATHPDTLPDSVVTGDLISGNATPKWARLPKGAHADGEVLTLVAGMPDWAATSGGGNVWPKVGKVNISSTEYATFALANTAAAGGDELLVGAGTNVCENVQAKDGIYITGSNPEDTILSATASLQTIKQAAATNTLTVKGVTFKTSYNPGASSTTYGLDASNLVARNCNFDSTNLYNNALGNAAAIGSSFANNTPIRTLVDCKLKARKTNAGATSIGLDATYGTWILEGGEIDAEDYAVNVSSINAVVELRGTKIIQGTINVVSGSIRGWYCDSVGNIWVLPGSAINFAAGVWLTDISQGLIINEGAFTTALAATDDGDTIKFDTGTYVLSSTQNIAKSITIEGEGLDATIINFTGSNQAAFDLTTDAKTIIFRNLTLNHTGGGTAATGVFSNNAITFILDNAQVLIPSGNPTDARPLWIEAGTWELRNGAKAKSTSGTNKYGIYNDSAAATITIGAGCEVGGGTNDIYGDQSGSTITLNSAILTNDSVSWAGIFNWEPENKIPKNLLYNSLIYTQCWQRGTTLNDLADDSYGPDSWNVLNKDNAPDISGQAGGSTDPFATSFRCTFDSNTAQAGIVHFLEAEDTYPLRGQVVSLSADLWGTNITTLRMAIIVWTSTADTLTSDVVGTWGTGNPTLATNWAYIGTPAAITISSTRTRYAVNNLAVPTNANNIGVFIWTDAAESSGDLWEVARVQLERGPVATEFVAREIKEEMGRCLRYYCLAGQGTNGVWVSATQVDVQLRFPVEMRVAPAPGLTTTAPVIDETGVAARTGTASAISGIYNSSTRGIYVRINGFTGATAGKFGAPEDDYFTFSADL